MDKVSKILSKINYKDRERIIKALEKILASNTKGLDIKKLKGHPNILRVRIGNYRMVCKEVDGEYLVLELAKRNDNTYKKY